MVGTSARLLRLLTLLQSRGFWSGAELAERLEVAPMYIETPRVRPEVLSALAAACRNHQQASFRYADGRDRTTQRATQPYGVVHTGSRWYLAAFDEDRDDWRTFRLDRIEGAVSLGDDSPRASSPRVTSRRTSRGRSRRTPIATARVLIHAPLHQVRARVPPLAGYLRRVDAKRCRLESGADSLTRLAVYIAALGEEFEVEDPPELRRELDELAARIRRSTRTNRTRTHGARRPSKGG